MRKYTCNGSHLGQSLLNLCEPTFLHMKHDRSHKIPLFFLGWLFFPCAWHVLIKFLFKDKIFLKTILNIPRGASTATKKTTDKLPSQLIKQWCCLDFGNPTNPPGRSPDKRLGLFHWPCCWFCFYSTNTSQMKE